MIPNQGILIGRLFFLILLLAAILRFYGLERLGLWADEIWVVMDSSKGSLRDLLLTIYYQDNHPPGHYLLSRYLQMLMGASDFAIRLPSAVAGILLVAATFMAGKKYLSPESALIAAVLVAGSYQGIYHSQEARPNIFVALFTLLSFHYFKVLVLEGDRRYKNFMAFWLFAALNAYFHYVGLVFVFTLLVIYLGFLVLHRNRDYLLLGVKAFGPVLLLYAPWLPGMYYDLVASPPELWQHVPTPKTLVNSFFYLFGPGDLRVYVYALVFIVTPLWISAIIFIKPWREKYKNEGKIAALLWLCIVLPIAFFYLKSIYSQPAYNHRHFLHAIPMMSLLVGAVLAKGLAYISDKHRPKFLIVIIGFIIVYQWMANYHYALYRSNHFKQDYRESAKFLAGAEKNEAVVISNSRFFDHYLGLFSKDRLKISLLIENSNHLSQLAPLLNSQGHPQFYYLEQPLMPAANKMVTAIDELLAKQYSVVCRNKFLKTQVILFENKKPSMDTMIRWEDLPTCTTEKQNPQ